MFIECLLFIRYYVIGKEHMIICHIFERLMICYDPETLEVSNLLC